MGVRGTSHGGGTPSSCNSFPHAASPIALTTMATVSVHNCWQTRGGVFVLEALCRMRYILQGGVVLFLGTAM